MYTLRDYGDMIADDIRTEAYVTALRAIMQPGMTVLDIGTGFGFFAVLACQLGARHVYAVEPNAAIHTGRAIARANDCADRITFIRGLSTGVSLPEPVDLIVSDLRGMSPLYRGHLPAIIDARARLLKPGGVLLPRRDDLWLSLATSQAVYLRYRDPWLHNHYGIDLRPGWTAISNTLVNGRVSRDQLLTAPARWATLDYTTLTTPHAAATLEQPVTQMGTAHGLRLWFETTLTDGVTCSNAPDSGVMIYSHQLLLLPEPVAVAPGDTLRLDLSARLVGDDYVWSWRTEILDAAGAYKARFNQSTFFSEPLSPAALRRGSPGFTPRPSPDGELVRFVLNAMTGAQTNHAIAEAALAAFPTRFATIDEAAALVAQIARQYSL